MEQLNIAKNSNIYQFKITLKDRKPKVWRRIQVPESYSFNDLHLAIQDAMMGWKNYHLHQFEMINPKNFQKVVIGDCSFHPNIPEKETKIAEYFLPTNNSATYKYDLGIECEHEIILEKILPAVVGADYPQCIAGKQACPPEVGVGEGSDENDDFNPEEFDPKLVKFGTVKDFL